MKYPGIGYMIQELCGYTGDNPERVKGGIIASVEIDPEGNGGDGELRIAFAHGEKLILGDNARSCCESRYMHTDDDLPSFVGAIFDKIEIVDAPDIDDGHESHEVQFLKIYTSLGVFTIETHNEHNGYYGGFYCVAKIMGIDNA